MLNYVSCFCMNSLYILDINPFVECVICKYLLPFSRLPFCFDDSYPLLCFLVHCSPIYLFLFLPLKLDPEKITKINVSEVSTYVSSRSFMVLGLTLKSLIHFKLIFACGSIVKESTCNAQDLGLIPRLGRSSGEGKGYPLQYSGLENPMDYIVHGVTKSWTWLSGFHFISLHGVSGLIIVFICVPLLTPQEMQVQSLGLEGPLEEQMATHPSILAGKIPLTEEPGGLEPMGLQRVGHDWTGMHILVLLTPFYWWDFLFSTVCSWLLCNKLIVHISIDIYIYSLAIICIFKLLRKTGNIIDDLCIIDLLMRKYFFSRILMQQCIWWEENSLLLLVTKLCPAF